MKTAGTYVFMFVPIPRSWLLHEPMIRGFGAGSNGSSPTDQNDIERSQWLGMRRCECEAEALPNHLFWTWFVDNPRPEPAVNTRRKN
jgi:hypothetical protein